MESNWRFNVALYGLSGTFVRLIAPLLARPDILVSNFVDSFPVQFVHWQVPHPGDLPVILELVIAPAGHPHYPYGQPVTGD